MKNFYLLLAVLGFVLPYYFFISFLLSYGLESPPASTTNLPATRMSGTTICT